MAARAVWTRPRAEQSYADLQGLLDKLIAMLTAVPGYATGAPSDLTLVSLTALSTALDTMNKTVGTNEAALASPDRPPPSATSRHEATIDE